MTTFVTKTDFIGAIAGSLCVLHCISTPFIFIAKTCSTTCCTDSPFWWQIMDFAFLVISFFAIYHTTKTSSKNWLKITFWTSWSFLLILLINKQLEYIPLDEKLIYIPALLIVVLHIYNIKYCKCSIDKCCINNQ